MSDKNLFIIAGCNGSGKTTASFTILPEMINCKEFVNADEIAKGISPFQPEKIAFEAGRLMLNRINELLYLNENFAFETTLSTKSYRSKILKAKENNYSITLIFFWLQNVELAMERVRTRVSEGGHNIPENVIARRYLRGIINLFDIYLPLADGAFIFDNSNGKHELLAEKTTQGELNIIDNIKFAQIKKYYDDNRKAK